VRLASKRRPLILAASVGGLVAALFIAVRESLLGPRPPVRGSAARCLRRVGDRGSGNAGRLSARVAGRSTEGRLVLIRDIIIRRRTHKEEAARLAASSL
jgi:hypothetical protein